jgi:hypothetical protein
MKATVFRGGNFLVAKGFGGTIFDGVLNGW